MSHKHDLKKTHVTFIEFDDVDISKLAKDSRYFGEGNSKGRLLDFDFEYCVNCNFRLLNGKPIMTKNILDGEFERFVIQTKKGKHINSEQTTLQHSNFEIIERLIQKALELGKLKEING